MRRFAFESRCLQDAFVRADVGAQKLDRAAIKIGLEQWLSFDKGPTTTLFLSTRYRTTHSRICRHIRMFMKKHGGSGSLPRAVSEAPSLQTNFPDESGLIQ